jgi:hypothetical protein
MLTEALLDARMGIVTVDIYAPGKWQFRGRQTQPSHSLETDLERDQKNAVSVQPFSIMPHYRTMAQAIQLSNRISLQFALWSRDVIEAQLNTQALSPRLMGDHDAETGKAILGVSCQLPDVSQSRSFSTWHTTVEDQPNQMRINLYYNSSRFNQLMWPTYQDDAGVSCLSPVYLEPCPQKNEWLRNINTQHSS